MKRSRKRKRNQSHASKKSGCLGLFVGAAVVVAGIIAIGNDGTEIFGIAFVVTGLAIGLRRRHKERLSASVCITPAKDSPKKRNAAMEKKHADIGHEMLKQSTAHYKAGRIEAAIQTLRLAYEELKLSGDCQTVETLARLPMYLQQAGRTQEAWDELTKLLSDTSLVPPNSYSELIPMVHSQVYDKMRLLLQRNEQMKLAVAYGVASHYSWCMGLRRQNRKEELEECLSKSYETEFFSKLLSKAECIERMDDLLGFCDKVKKTIPNVDADATIAGVCGILGISPSA